MGQVYRLPSRLFWMRALGLIAVSTGSSFGPPPAFAGESDPTSVVASDSQTSPNAVVEHIDDDDEEDDDESNDCN